MDSVIIGIAILVEIILILGVGLIATVFELFLVIDIIYKLNKLNIIKNTFTKIDKKYNPNFSIKEILLLLLFSIINSYIIFHYLVPFVNHSNIQFIVPT